MFQPKRVGTSVVRCAYFLRPKSWALRRICGKGDKAMSCASRTICLDLDIFSKTMARNTALLLSFLLVLGLRAQPVFIPDLQFRAALNAWEPGLVDADGYIQEMNIDLMSTSWDLVVDWTPCDLTGIERFVGLNYLSIDFVDQVELTWNESPMNLGYITLTNFPNAPLPTPLSGGLIELNIRASPDVTMLETLPSVLTLILDSLPNLTEPPVLPVGMLTFISRWYPAAIPFPTIPNDIGYLEFRNSVNSQLPAIPLGIALLVVESMPNVTEVAIPMGLETLHIISTGVQEINAPQLVSGAFIRILDNPALTTATFEGTIYQLELRDAMALVNLSISGTAQFVTLDRVPVLNAITDLGDEIYLLEILDAASLSWLPELPDILDGMIIASCPGIIELPTLPPMMTRLLVADVPLLCLPVLPQGLTQLELLGTQLNCIPNHPSGVEELFPLCSVVNSRCKEDCPYAAGTLFWDPDQSGSLSAGDAGIPFGTIIAQPSGYMAATDANGNYVMAVPYGSSTLSAYTVVANGGTDPAAHDVLFQFGGVSITGLDFRVDQIPLNSDLRVMHAWGPTRRSNVAENTVVVTNVGPTRYGVEVRLTMDPLIQYQSSDPIAVMEGTDLVWYFDSLTIGNVLQLRSRYFVPQVLGLGTLLNTTATITPLEGDMDVTNNLHDAQSIVTGSYDPNDKQVFPAELTPEEAGSGRRVEYLIRFQNTGTSWADRVLIIDTLSTDLDPETFQFLGSSHTSTWFFRDGALHFLFDPIFLPDSTADEPGSHGFVSFSIATRGGLLPGSTLSNVADIYFDFNEPVITDPCILTVDLESAIAEHEQNGLRAFPNPTNSVLYVEHDGRWDGARATILNALGSMVATMPISGRRAAFNISGLTPGLYLVRLEKEGEQSTSRVVVE